METEPTSVVRHNAFISYAWVDNQPSLQDQVGWVSTFVDGLRKHLGRELGRKVQGDRVWLDYERLRGSDNINGIIRSELESTHLLVPILSRGYLDSPWCRQELETFLGLHGGDSGRIFPVWMSPADDLPPELKALLKYKFWYEDEARKPRTHWFPNPDPTDRHYGDIQQDMARDMVARLAELSGHEKSAPLPAAALAADPAAGSGAASPGTLVLINGGDADAALIQTVVQRLRNTYKLGVLQPQSMDKRRPGLKSSDITRDLRDKIKLCKALLIVYREGPHHQIDRQLIEYLKIAARRPKDQAPPLLIVCRPQGTELQLTVYPPDLLELPCGTEWNIDCVDSFVRSLA